MIQKLVLSFTILSFLSLPGDSQPELPNFSGQLFLKSELLDDAIYLAEGMAHRNNGVRVDSNTIFDIASINKSFIANLVLQAVAERRWQRNTGLNELMERYGFECRFSPKVNLHKMLCHRSGLGDYDDLDSLWKRDNFRSYKRMHFSNEAYLNFLSQQKAQSPDSAFYYSNFAYHVLAILLEEEYQKPMDEILQDKIANPLRMQALRSPKSRREVIDNLAVGYQMREGQFLANEFIDLSLGRRIFCNAHDLMLWLEADCGASLLPDSLRPLIRENIVADLGEANSYSYGWVPFKKGEHFRMGDLDLNQDYIIHGGSTEGFQSLAISVNQRETNLVLLANNGDGRALFERAKSILKKLYNED